MYSSIDQFYRSRYWVIRWWQRFPSCPWRNLWCALLLLLLLLMVVILIRSDVYTISVGFINPPLIIIGVEIDVGIIRGTQPRFAIIEHFPRIFDFPMVLYAYFFKSRWNTSCRCPCIVRVHTFDCWSPDSNDRWWWRRFRRRRQRRCACLGSSSSSWKRGGSHWCHKCWFDNRIPAIDRHE